ncbi:MAG: acetylxylan esterase [Spirochaetes bacterium]|jgi:cephalosporin-C deacetylase-like acetyl esterase|nr:acetylxylan esterase [Spirochaetota bacterium]
MPAINSFDKYFLHLPPLNSEPDFEQFWDQSIQSLDKVPIEPVVEKVNNKIPETFELYNIIYKSTGKSSVRGQLALPRKIKKPKVIIILPDYNQIYKPPYGLFDDGVAYFIMQLRGHDMIKKAGPKEEQKTPGFLSDNLLDKNQYYARSIYLDAYRITGMLRLINQLDCSSIGIIGKGFGAAPAAFLAAHSDRIACAVLDTPYFCYLDLSQNISRSVAAAEINNFISSNKSKKKLIKSNMSYFDIINFSREIKCPVLVTVGLKDSISPPECVFALFNHLHCEKTAEIYPEDGNSAGGENQLKKSIFWIKNILLGA